MLYVRDDSTDELIGHSVPVTISGAPETAEVKNLPKHKKNPDGGEKKTVFAKSVLVEQEDAASFEDNEEVSPWISSILKQCLRTCEDHLDGLG